MKSVRAIGGPAHGRMFECAPGEEIINVPVAIGRRHQVSTVRYRLTGLARAGALRLFWLPADMNMAEAEAKFGGLDRIWESAA